MKNDHEYYRRFLLDRDAWKPLFPHDLDRLDLQGPEDIRHDQKPPRERRDKRAQHRGRKE